MKLLRSLLLEDDRAQTDNDAPSRSRAPAAPSRLGVGSRPRRGALPSPPSAGSNAEKRRFGEASRDGPRLTLRPSRDGPQRREMTSPRKNMLRLMYLPSSEGSNLWLSHPARSTMFSLDTVAALAGAPPSRRENVGNLSRDKVNKTWDRLLHSFQRVWEYRRRSSPFSMRRSTSVAEWTGISLRPCTKKPRSASSLTGKPSGFRGPVPNKSVTRSLKISKYDTRATNPAIFIPSSNLNKSCMANGRMPGSWNVPSIECVFPEFV
mmetsp:Transcript_83132/g.240589  ORF Transcript_83132/g.240589 Transcript_83132/m.240589 type:complete len:264 (+) Transcript_83132:698-1489(+)